jgi:hypothetical protein
MRDEREGKEFVGKNNEVTLCAQIQLKNFATIYFLASCIYIIFY